MEESSRNTQCTAIIFIRWLPSTTNFSEAKLSCASLSSIFCNYSKTFSPANLSQSQIINNPKIFKDISTNNSNQQQLQVAATSSSYKQQQPAAATSSRNQQQQPAAATSSSDQKQQSTAATNSSNQQQQSTSATTSTRPTSSI